MRIKSTCNYYTTFFHLCSALYRHIKARCNVFKRIALAKIDLGPFFATPIFCSKAKLSALGAGLMFRRWSYITTLITFDPAILPVVSNPNSLMCLDTRCEVILINKI